MHSVICGPLRRAASASLFVLAASLTGQSPNLRVLAVDPTGAIVDAQALALTGSANATIDNNGAGNANGPFTVLFFEDTDHSGDWTPSGDRRLGSTNVAALAAGANTTVSAAVAGPVLFAGNLIFALVDADDAITETNETDNLGDSGRACLYQPQPGAFSPIIEWQKTTHTVEPGSNQIMMTPAIVDLTADGIPDIVFSTFTGGGYVTNGRLRAISGNGGAELWTVVDPSHRVRGAASVAAGDIDADGRPEVLAVAESGNVLLAFEHDGTFKWQSPALETINWGGPAITDLDGEGTPEIVVGRQVLNHDGTLRWTGAGARGDNGVGPLSVVADVDVDGLPNIVAGTTVYDHLGAIRWSNPGLGDGFNAVANFDADPQAEVVLVRVGQVFLLQHDMTVIWQTALPGGGRGGPPTVADFDGDGLPEIGVAGAGAYAVFDTGGTVLWSSPTQDNSSNVTGSSVFDFEGDGAAEVVYRDELFLRVYRGSTGQVLFQEPMGSGTTYEYVQIVDIDADGNAEIVAVANNYAFGNRTGVFVYGDANDNWVTTRRIWNQHTYHITNVNDDGTIPAVAAINWLTPAGNVYNNFRQNLPSGNPPATIAPDLTASLLRCSSTAASTALVVRIGNGGANRVGTGLPVSFYDGDPAAGGQLLGTANTQGPIEPGAYEDVTLTRPGPLNLVNPITAVADDAGGLNGIANECNENNNRHTVANCTFFPPTFDPPSPCGQRLTIVNGARLTFQIVASDVDPGDLVTLAATVLPTGATWTPLLPATGNPVSTVFSWTPTLAQIGTWHLELTATDRGGLQTRCPITIDVHSECHLLLGPQSANIPIGGGDALLVLPTEYFPVITSVVPTLPIPRSNSLRGLQVFAQVLMYNPWVFPTDPVRVSNGVRIVIDGATSPYGQARGLTLTVPGGAPLGGTTTFQFQLN
ncbi:MAG: VCBS repeat-containing protein [Planctomycetes bacterium]|nr:VCBS repeat-containing protein [Planctomycetota bacterium]